MREYYAWSVPLEGGNHLDVYELFTTDQEDPDGYDIWYLGVHINLGSMFFNKPTDQEARDCFAEWRKDHPV